MDKKIQDAYTRILKSELKVALGCTEPIAIAYAGAKVRETLGILPEHLVVSCSGNIVKNVKAVTVPNSDGQRGIEVAATLGVVGGDASKELAVLETVTPEAIQKCRNLLTGDYVECNLVENVANLYVDIKAFAQGHSAEVLIRDYHTNIVRILKDDAIVFEKQESTDGSNASDPDKELLNVKDILEFADTVDLADLRETLDRQIQYNTAIAKAGLDHAYGAEVGRTILENGNPDEPSVMAKAMAAAGSDARMNGCPLPVVINSGSGNQGITVSLPIIVYAKALKVSQEKLYRALIVGNLISVHQKRFIGSLSAYCGATSAGCGSGTGIAYLLGMDYQQISNVITNSIATIGGMICDGAKSSCAAKIAASIETALNAVRMAKKGRVFLNGEGVVKENVEKTIACVGDVGRVGMKSTDVEILNLMLGKVALDH
jgi:L-cysteine desulfidase